MLLDTFSGAAAAYSLRDLSKDTTNVIRVRRSSDNTEQDFTASQITDGTLVSFCGTGDGLVTTWYDQSGNANDATQTTAASQPKIVDAGALVTENGRPALDFDGVDDGLQYFGAYNYGEKNNFLLSFVGILSGINVCRHIEIGSGDGPTEIGFRDNLQFFPSSFLYLIEYDKNLPDYGIFTGQMTTSNVFQFENGEEKSSGERGQLASNCNKISIGKGENGENPADIKPSEIIIYDRNIPINREAIEQNIASHYGITLA